MENLKIKCLWEDYQYSTPLNDLYLSLVKLKAYNWNDVNVQFSYDAYSCFINHPNVVELITGTTKEVKVLSKKNGRFFPFIGSYATP